MSARDDWIVAFAAADRGRPAALARLFLECNGKVPDYAVERLTAFIAKPRSGRPVKRDANGLTEKQRRGGQAYDYMRRRIEEDRLTFAQAAADARQVGGFAEFHEYQLEKIARGNVKYYKVARGAKRGSQN